MKKSIHISIFVVGIIVLLFELTGARIIAPYFGTSIYVWTGVIGVILGSLSGGYWYGGSRADQNKSRSEYTQLLLLAVVGISFTLFAKGIILSAVALRIDDIRIGALLASIFLFSPTSFLLGMTTPYALRITLNDVNMAGRVTGNLYALSTIGSIIGTFLGGFFLIPLLGIRGVLLVCIALLFIIVLLVDRKQFMKVLVLLLVIVFALFFSSTKSTAIVHYETPYNHLLVYENVDQKTGEEIKILQVDNYISSAVFKCKEGLVYDYLKYYRLDKHINPAFKKTLMIGGSACTYPRELISRNKKVTIDVVEIDERLVKLAKEEFSLVEDQRMRFFYEDGRVFLNRNQEKYDIVYVDAFTSNFSLPYQLTTTEAVQKIHQSLTEGGGVIVNLLSSLEKGKDTFLRAELATYQSIFPYVYLFRVEGLNSTLDHVQNVCLVATRKELSKEAINDEVADYLQNQFILTGEVLPILTDDKAPVAYYLNQAY